MRRDNERFLSVHMFKTGGTSVRDFFERFYGPENVHLYDEETKGFYRADQDGGIKDSNFLLLRELITKNKHTELLYLLFVNKVKKIIGRQSEHIVNQKQIQTQPPDSFSVIHGHFTTNDVKIDEARYVTVLREPLKRATSHYKYYHWLHSAGFGHKLPDWFDPGMTFARFTVQEDVRNLQTRHIGDIPLANFARIGVTDDLEHYVRGFDSNKTVKIRRLNQTRPNVAPQISNDEKTFFIEQNAGDYQLYKEALSIIQHRKGL